MGAKAQELPFAELNEASSKTINADVEQSTNGTIRNILQNIHQETKLLLLSAIHFKKAWKKPFIGYYAEYYSDNRFFLSSGQIVKVVFMAQETDFYYYEGSEGVKALEMSYKTGNQSMVFVLPPEGTSLTEFISTYSKYGEILHGLRSYVVKVVIPRFKLTNSHRLVPHLKELGITDVFDPELADLSKILTKNEDGVRLCASEAIQMAMIEVNEEGTVATALDSVISLGSEPRKVEFIANRPFLYMLLDNCGLKSKASNESPNVLFIGVVEDPTKQ